jgi:hypothetical protein
MNVATGMDRKHSMSYGNSTYFQTSKTYFRQQRAANYIICFFGSANLDCCISLDGVLRETKMAYLLGIGTQLFPSKIASLSLEESIKQLYALTK